MDNKKNLIMLYNNAINDAKTIFEEFHLMYESLLKCPIGLNTFEMPIIASDNVTYDYENFQNFLKMNEGEFVKSPITREVLQKSFYKNLLIKQCKELSEKFNEKYHTFLEERNIFKGVYKCNSEDDANNTEVFDESYNIDITTKLLSMENNIIEMKKEVCELEQNIKKLNSEVFVMTKKNVELEHTVEFYINECKEKTDYIEFLNQVLETQEKNILKNVNVIKNSDIEKLKRTNFFLVGNHRFIIET